MNQFQSYIHMSRYSRWRDDLGRRELWPETVDRLIDFYVQRFPVYTDLFRTEIKDAILNLEVMPSMRSLMTAGPALDRENIAAYNCYYHAVNHPKKFSETLYILMCGTGVGFSCEEQEVQNLPVVPDKFVFTSDTVQVADSKEGWARAYRKLITALYEGDVPQFDYAKVRPAGARLHTFGGRASGPEPLERLFEFTIKTFVAAAGRRLRPREVHDIMCVIGEVVVVGGVRRSALISLSDLGDAEMRNAKSGAVYKSKPDAEVFLDEWLSLVKSKSGERGIFNREAAQKQAAKYGRDPTLAYGCNPCSEIILRDGQFCNLTEVVVRPEDTFESLMRKVRIASILGTFQSTLTDFHFVRSDIKKNTEEERLLGVSLTGVYDNPILADPTAVSLPQILTELRLYAREVNHEFAAALGIPVSASITCVKPSGTVSKLCDTASGLHPRFAEQFLQTIRIDKKDPLYQFLKDEGMYVEDCVRQPRDMAIVYFPMHSPKTCRTGEGLSALEHLDLWLLYQRYWCEHKPSVTVYVRDHEWPEVGAWVYKNFDEVSGISFLPFSDHTYKQAPWTRISAEDLVQWEQQNPMPVLDWTKLSKYEQEDNTTGTQEYACVGGTCELP
jgi:ribonucleoside-diphosphate reductase alpha chain